MQISFCAFKAKIPSIIMRLTHANVWSLWESLAAACSFKKPYFVPQLMQESVSGYYKGTTSHVNLAYQYYRPNLVPSPLEDWERG